MLQPSLKEYIEKLPLDNIKLNLSETSLKILHERYLIKNDLREVIESPIEMYIRVAQSMASIEKTNEEQIYWFNQFFYGMLNQDWSPSSPVLMNAGTCMAQLSACFILDIEDSMEDIFDKLKEAALIYKSGGGVGFNFANLREKGALIRSTKGYSAGVITWLKIYDTSINGIAQGGKRRGAALGVLPIWHPDIEEWLEVKKHENMVTNFNLSVAIDSSFMKKLASNELYDLVSPLGYIVKKIPAQELWHKLCYQTWSNGEPGLFFIDRVNQDNANPHLGTIKSGNPCSEFVNIPYSSCSLASINLEKHCSSINNNVSFDWNKFKLTIKTIQRFLDNMIDINNLPLKKIETVTQNIRPIGIGFMGLARTLKLLGLGYSTEEGRQWVGKMMACLRETAEEASMDLAQTRGVYPAWKNSLWYKQGKFIRNSCLLAIAPTGTIATLCNTSWGLEPDFAPAFTRTILEGKNFIEIDPLLDTALACRGLLTDEIKEQIFNKGSIQEISDIPQTMKNFYQYAYDLTPEEHLKMQAVIQKHVDGACSKTVNIPYNSTVDDVKNTFSLAYSLGLKGCTIYRDGSRSVQVLSIKEKKSPKNSFPICETCRI